MVYSDLSLEMSNTVFSVSYCPNEANQAGVTVFLLLSMITRARA